MSKRRICEACWDMRCWQCVIFTCPCPHPWTAEADYQFEERRFWENQEFH